MTATITALRDMVPIRPMTVAESLRIAELQATKLRDLGEVAGPPLPETVITQLPRVQVERIIPAPVSGAAQWSHGRWLIILNGSEPLVRQRFSLAHEFKHILDNPFIDVLYPRMRGMSSAERAEQVCDYFAGCLLMPRLWLKRAWVNETQDQRKLAHRFNVSNQAMQVRLLQVGLIERQARCLMEPIRKEVASYDADCVPTR
jgi:Zn-dependent peptidase ImmA (M78 family)